MNLKEAILSGESKNLEFKSQLPNSNTLAKSIVAFSNTGGGKLLLGVDDKGKVIGVSSDVNILDLKDRIASMIYDTCYPTILPDIYTSSVDDCLLLIVEVYRGNLLPYFLKSQGKDNGVYIRIGATNRQASPENILELERQRMHFSYDQEINRNVDFTSLNLNPLSERFHRLNKILNIASMKNLKLIDEENGTIYPTNGLLILLGYFDHVRIKCSRFKGKTMDVFLDRKEYEGDIFTQLEESENFIKNYISLRSEINGLQRTDQYEIPIEAIRESLVNAVVHRDYVNSGRDIKIGIYDDVVNIVSPGGFPSTITQADLLEGRSEIRNKVLARVFKELNYIEQWGSGIRRIKSSCKAIGLREPEILEKGDFVDVSLYRSDANLEHDKVDDLITKKYQAKIIDYIKEKKQMTTKEAQQVLDLKERRARDVLKEMIDQGVLIRTGKTTNNYYVLKEQKTL